MLFRFILSILCVFSWASASAETGTDGFDILRGTPQADVIAGLGGTNHLFGRSGVDSFVITPAKDIQIDFIRDYDGDIIDVSGLGVGSLDEFQLAYNGVNGHAVILHGLNRIVIQNTQLSSIDFQYMDLTVALFGQSNAGSMNRSALSFVDASVIEGGTSLRQREERNDWNVLSGELFSDALNLTNQTHPDLFVWAQGEADANGLSDASAYQADLELLIQGLTIDTPFVVVLLNRRFEAYTNPNGGIPRQNEIRGSWDAIRAAQIAASAKYGHVHAIDPEPLVDAYEAIHGEGTAARDRIHYTNGMTGDNTEHDFAGLLWQTILSTIID